MAKRKVEKEETQECLYCGSVNVIHWITNGYRTVVHRCNDCKQKWTDTVEG